MKNCLLILSGFLAFCSSAAFATPSSTLECVVHDSKGITYTTKSTTIDAKGNASVTADLAGTDPALKIHASVYQNRLVELFLTTGVYPNEKGIFADVGIADKTSLSGIQLHAVENSNASFEGLCNIVTAK